MKKMPIKRNLKYVLLSCMLSYSTLQQAFSLEFGYMGGTSFSMGNAGVALKDSAWGIYYNPALLGADASTRLAYSIGANLKLSDNITKILSQGIANVQSNLTSFNPTGSLPNTQAGGGLSSFASGAFLSGSRVVAPSLMLAASSTSSTSSSQSQSSSTTTNGDIKAPGLLGEALKDLGIKDKDSLETFLKEHSNGTIDSVDKIKNATPENIGKVKDALVEGLQEVGKEAGADTSFLESLIKNTDASAISGLATKLQSGGDISTKDIIAALGGSFKITGGNNKNLNNFLSTLNQIQGAINHNIIKAYASSGVVYQQGLSNSALAFGILAQAYGTTSLNLDKRYNKLIIPGGGDLYLDVQTSKDSITFKTTEKSNYESSSVLSKNANHTLTISSIAIAEVPVAFGYEFDTFLGDISLGAAVKYMYGITYGSTNVLSLDNTNFNLEGRMKTSSAFGVDVGALYSIGGLSFGVVGKNLNQPTFKSLYSSDIKLNPQIRAGVGYKLGILSLALDYDLMANKTLSPLEDSQVLGGGVLLNLKVIDFRAGALYDFKSLANEGVILTFGTNILGLIDIAVQSSINALKFSPNDIPNYVSVNIGGSFKF